MVYDTTKTTLQRMRRGFGGSRGGGVVNGSRGGKDAMDIQGNSADNEFGWFLPWFNHVRFFARRSHCHKNDGLINQYLYVHIL